MFNINCCLTQEVTVLPHMHWNIFNPFSPSLFLYVSIYEHFYLGYNRVHRIASGALCWHLPSYRLTGLMSTELILRLWVRLNVLIYKFSEKIPLDLPLRFN